MFHLLFCPFCSSPLFRGFLHLCFYNDSYNLDIPDSLNHTREKKKISAETLYAAEKKCAQQQQHSRHIGAVTELSENGDTDN